MQDWYPLVYGKLTESPEGPIQLGKDHECTGKSASIPSFVFEQCEPKIIGPGINDLTPWSEYTWLDVGGGIALQSVRSGSDVWMVIGRIRGRSEAGEDRSGRYYMQGLYLCLPASQFSPLILSGLTDIQTIPMQAKDMDLPTQQLAFKDGPLDPDWIERCEMIFETLMTGSPLSIQASKMELPAMARLFQHVLCALPKALAWRLGLRLGSYEMSEEVGLAHGQRAMSGIRMMGFSTDDFERNRAKTNGYQMLPQWIEEADRRGLRDLSEGARYVQFLKQATADCQTFSDLISVVNRHFSDLAQWDAAPMDMSWQDLAQECTARLFEQDAMKAIREYLVQPQAEVPSIEGIKYYRAQILAELLEHPLSITSRLLEQTILLGDARDSNRYGSWAEAWEHCSVQNTAWSAISALFRSAHQIDERAMAYAQSLTDIPEALKALAHQSLHKQLETDFTIRSRASHWAMLFSGEQPQWLLDWREQNAAGLFWLSVRIRRVAGDDSLMQAGQSHSAWLFLSKLKSEAAIDESEGRQWCQALPSDGEAVLDFNAVVDDVMPVNVAHGLQMFGWSELELPLKKMLEGPELHQWEAGPLTAVDIANRVAKGLVLNPLLLRIILAYASHLTEALKEPVLRVVAQGCDAFYQRVFFGVALSSNADKWNSVAEQVVLERFLADSTMAKQVYQAVREPNIQQLKSASRIRQKLQDALKDETQDKPVDSVSQVLFYMARSTNAPPIEEDSIAGLAWLLDGFDLANASELVADLNSIRALLLLKPKKLLLTGARLIDIMKVPQIQDEFRAVAVQNKWTKEPAWRLLFIEDTAAVTQVIKPTDEEGRYLAGLDVSASFAYLNAGFVLLPHQLNKLASGDVDDIQVTDLQHLHILASVAAHTDASAYQEKIAHFAFQSAHGRDELDRLLRDYVLPIPWYKKIFSFMNALSKKVESTLSIKLNPKCETVSDAVDSFFVMVGREALQHWYQNFKRSA